MAIAEWLTRVEEEIQRVENALRESRRLLRTFLETLRPANPAVVEDRMRAGDQRIRGLRWSQKRSSFFLLLLQPSGQVTAAAGERS